MKRYLVTFMSFSTGQPMILKEYDRPADALRDARKATADGMRDVRIADGQTKEAFDANTFASMHRL